MARMTVVGDRGAIGRIAVGLACVLIAWCAPRTLGQDQALRSYFTANGLLNRGLYEEAIAEYEAYLKTDPQGTEAAIARYGLAVSLAKTGQSKAALAQLLELDPPGGFAFEFEANLLAGQLLYQDDRLEDAARLLGRIVRRSPKHAQAADAGGLWIECLHRLGEHREVLRRAREVVDALGNGPGDLGRLKLFTGLSLSALDRDREAAGLLVPLSERDDEIGLTATIGAARAFVQLGRLRDAAAMYEPLTRLDEVRWFAPAQLGLAHVRQAQGDYGQAITLLDGLIDRLPDGSSRAEALLSLGINQIESDAHESGRATLGRVPSSAGDSIASRVAYWRAKSLLREGDAEGAAVGLEAALERFPDSPIRAEMVYDRGVALGDAGRVEAAASVFVAFPEQFPDHRLATPAHLAGATALLELGRFDEARAQGESIPRTVQAYPEAQLILAESDAMLGHHERVVGLLRPWLDEHGDRDSADRATYRLAMSLASLGELPEAETVAAPLFADEIDPRFRTGLLVLGDAAYNAKAWDRAEHWYGRAVALGVVPVASAQLKLGLTRAQQGRHKEAAELFEQAGAGSETTDTTLHALFELGQTRMALKDDARARAAFEALLERGEQSRFSGYAMQHLGGIAERAGKPEAAARYYQQAARENPQIRDAARRDQARALLASGDFDAVRALAARTDDQDILALGGVAQSRAGDHAGAIKTIDRVLAMDGSPSEAVGRGALFERAWCLRQIGDDDAALRALEHLSDEAATDRYAIFASLEAAAIELDAGRSDEAGSWLDRATAMMEARPESIEPAMASQLRFRLAQRAGAAERFEEVVERLESFDRDYPKSVLTPSAFVLLGDAHLALSQPRLAVAAYRAAAAGANAELVAPATLRLGDAVAQTGAWAQSRAIFEGFLEHHAESPFAYEARFGVGWALEHEGDFEQARAWYGRVIASHEGPTAARAQFQIGECLFAEGRHEEAVRELLRVDILYDYPQWSAAAMYEAGRAFEQLRKFGEARQQYRETVERFAGTSWAQLAQERLGRLASTEGP